MDDPPALDIDPERLARLRRYAADVEAGRPIRFLECNEVFDVKRQAV